MVWCELYRYQPFFTGINHFQESYDGGSPEASCSKSKAKANAVLVRVLSIPHLKNDLEKKEGEHQPDGQSHDGPLVIKQNG